MALGGVTATLTTGGGSAVASGADLARTIIGMGVCTAGVPAKLYHPAGSGAMRSALGVGQLPETQALLFSVAGAPSPYAMPVNPSVAGGFGTVAQKGNGAGTITPSAAPHVPVKVKCSTGGTLTTAAFQFSLDGGITYSAPVVSGAGPWVYIVPGTYLSLSFGAATYVQTETKTYNTDGTVTTSGGWVGVVTPTASPIDNYDVVATVQAGGALGAVTLAVSLDGGRTQFGPALLVPSGGIVVVPGTGIFLTCANAFTAADAYSFPAAGPGPSSGDVTAALNALLVDPSAPPSAVIDFGMLPGSAASAFTQAQSLQTFLDTAFAAGKDWQAIMTCPLKGDIIVLAGVTQIDTADDRSTVKTARAGKDCRRVSVFDGTDNVQSAITNNQVRRPRSSVFAARIATKLPVEKDRSTVATRDAPLLVAAIGDDEFYAAVSLYDAQINSFQTLGNGGGAYLTIGRGLYGWQGLTTDANLIDQDGLRAVNAILAGFRPVAAKMVGRKYPINADGTIEEKTALGLDSLLDAAIKKRAGFGNGGDFGGVPQVSSATASVLRSTNLGPLGSKAIGVSVSILPLGFASAVDINIFFQGA